MRITTVITIDNVQYRNLEEQVKKNMDDIQYILEEEGVLNEFGIRVVGQITSSSDLPDPNTYQGEYGDAYAVGTTAPYTLYIYTRANGTHPNDYWFNIGQFPAPGNIPGPTGPQGPVGPAGTRGSTWTNGTGNPTSTSGFLVNDKYLNTSDGTVFNFNGSQWQNVGSIRGPQGIQGQQGPVGPQGAQGIQGPKGDTGPAGPAFVIAGTVANEGQLPNPSTVADNIAYLVGTEATGFDLYVQLQDSDTWQNVGKVENVEGPQGPTGPQGPQGPQGPVGPQGPQGPQGEGIDDLLNGTEIAKKAEQDAEGNNIVDTYAKQNGGIYESMTVGKALYASSAERDENGAVISAVYAKKSELSYTHYLTVDLSNKFHFVCSIRNKSSAQITSKSELLQALLNIGTGKGISATGFLFDSTKGGMIFEVAATSSTTMRLKTVSTPDAGNVNTYDFDTASDAIGVQDIVPTL